MIISILALVAVGLFWVIKTIAPEMMAKSPAVTKVDPPVEAKVPTQTDTESDFNDKLESMLAEKNKTISVLQLEVKFYQTQTRAFDKVKTLFNEEIERLKEQNRILKAELEASVSHSKQNSTT